MLLINFQGMVPFMSSKILSSFKKDTTIHTANNVIESLIYVLVGFVFFMLVHPLFVKTSKSPRLL